MQTITVCRKFNYIFTILKTTPQSVRRYQKMEKTYCRLL